MASQRQGSGGIEPGAASLVPANGRRRGDARMQGRSDGHEQLAELQRARIVAGMTAAVVEVGVGSATVARVVARSGVSRRTFYEQFVDREECFIAAFDTAVQRLAASVVPAYRAPAKWPERVRAGLAALLQALEDNPAAARLAVVETFGAGPRALARRREVESRLIAAVKEGRAAAAGEPPPPLAAEGVVGGALSLIHARMLDGQPLADLLAPLTAMIVLPYLGAAAARREMRRHVPRPGQNGSARVAAGEDPLRHLGARLTYRTVRVLVAVGELCDRASPIAHGSSDGQGSPGAGGSNPSNRAVGEAAGIRDQGQISKLLARLEQLGLVRNTVDRRFKGEANSWVLTERGEAVRAVLPA
jgi:AcrR family transcriptional regulator